MVAPIDEIRTDVQSRLDQAAARLAFRLVVTGDRVEDDWIHLIVRPDREGVHSEDYVGVLAKVEEEVERERGIHLLLVPAVPVD